ncbi:hypothetical protein UT300005_06050 [Clostridium sp. CTA-5]
MSSIFKNAIFKELFKKYTYNLNSSLYPILQAQTIGDKIKLLRLNNGLTQLQFGKSINKALTTIANFENGHRIPSDSILNDIINIYNLNKNYFK